MKKTVFCSMISLVAATLTQQANAQDTTSCCAVPSQDFPKVGGNLGNTSHSALAQITAGNVAQLGGAWHALLEGGDKSSFQQGNLIEVGGVVYAETTQGSVIALDAATGAEKWRFKPDYGPALRRGLAVGEGKVFTVKGSAGHVIALDQKTGKPLWDKTPADPRIEGQLVTSMIYHNGRVYVGSGNGDRGAAYAIDAKTGETIWKMQGAPGPGNPGNETWAGQSWETGGAAPWQHPAIDPQLGLVYWTFGNPRSDSTLDGRGRAGDNLFANSLVAIDIKTGKRVWYFQSVHHDIWDMDNVMAPVLLDMKVNGRMRQAVIYGSKTAMVYILDRKTGKPIHHIDERPVPQEPAQHTSPTQPFPRDADTLVNTCPEGKIPPHYKTGCIFTPHMFDPIITYPGIGGGADTSAFSYDPDTGLLYVGVGIVAVAQSLRDKGVGFRPLGSERSGRIVAFDPRTQKIVWSQTNQWSLAHGNGVLSTAGGLLFMGFPDGYIVALDRKDGRELWRFQTGAGVHTSPISYRVGKEQFVAVLAGGNALPYNSPKGDHLWAFKLGGTVAQAPTPPAPPQRQPIIAAPVDGATNGNLVKLGVVAGNPPRESDGQSAMLPQHLRVPVGTTVTFENPATNKADHCATQFFEGLFDSGALKPGQTFTYTFKAKGEFYYNDCAFPGTTGKITVIDTVKP